MTIYLDIFDAPPAAANPEPLQAWRVPSEPGTARVNAHWQAGRTGTFRLMPVGEGSFGLAYLVRMRAGQALEGRLRCEIPGGVTCKIEVSGFTTRYQRAFLTFDGEGRVLDQGDEILDCVARQTSDGLVELNFAFRPAATREDWVNVLFSPVDSGRDHLPSLAGFTIHARDHNPHYRGHQPALRLADGTLFALQSAYVFRNYFHFDFELCRPGVPIRGIELQCPVRVYGVRWLTSATLEVEGAGPRPERPGYPMVSAALLDELGVEGGSHAHTLFGLVAQPLDLQYVSVDESDALREFSLKVRYADGTELVQSLSPASGTVEESAFWSRMMVRIQESIPATGRTFLEVGGRGEASALVRSLLGPGWDYRAMDIHPGPNVDLVGDAHHLSELLPPCSVDVVYSSDVMEHFLAPWRFVIEANRVLRPGGLFVAMVPTTWSLHAEPWDFWRMSGHGWPALLNHGTGFQLLESAVIDQSVIVPRLPVLSGRTRAQYAPAYEHTFAIARKTTESTATWEAYDVAWAAGRYER